MKLYYIKHMIYILEVQVLEDQSSIVKKGKYIKISHFGNLSKMYLQEENLKYCGEKSSRARL